MRIEPVGKIRCMVREVSAHQPRQLPSIARKIVTAEQREPGQASIAPLCESLSQIGIG